MTLFTQPSLLDSARWSGMRIGLLGGSFNPPHDGHVHISLAAMKALKLDVVWWLVTPQNPLKTHKPAPLQTRMEQCRKIATHPKIIISDIEAELGTHITYHTVKKLKQRHPSAKFVWISGMDNALSLHRWHHWRELLRLIPTVHLTRNPATSLIRRSPLRLYNKQHHVFIDRPAKYPLDSGTTFWMLQKKMVNISSTDIRNNMLNTQ